MRRKCRLSALQVLYLYTISDSKILLDIEKLFQYYNLPEKYHSFAKELTDGVIKFQKQIDSIISKYLIHWEFDRLSIVDKNILRIATYELLSKNLTPNIIINEAIEIAKEYSTEKSGRFVNGLLDKIKDEKNLTL